MSLAEWSICVAQCLAVPAFFFFRLKIMLDSDDEVIVEEDPADAQAESYIWKYFVDVAQYGRKGSSKVHVL